MTGAPVASPDRRSRGSGGPRLFERAPFLDEFEALFTGSLVVPSHCIAIEGSGGSGRTALINAAADLASRAGCLVLRAKGGEVERQTPYAVLGRLVESAEALAADDESTQEQARTIEQLLGDRQGLPADPAQIASLFHRLVLRLRRAAPVLLAIDDADRADPDTLDALRYLVRRLDHQQIWSVVSARPLHPGVGLRPIDGLLTEPDTRLFVLEPLQAASVEAILAGFFEEEPDPEFVARYTVATGGSPFLLKALLPSLLRNGVRPSAGLAGSIEQVRAPKVTQYVLGRFSQLPEGAVDFLRACTVLGESADPLVARELAHVDAATAERSAEAAEEAELLHPGRPSRFTSPVIRWAVYYDIPRAQRSELHAEAAGLLEANGADEALVAEHLLATEVVGSTVIAQWLHRLGRRALATGSSDLALRCLDRAVTEYPVAERRSDLYLDLAAAELAGRGASALAHLQQAMELNGSDGPALVRVALDLYSRVSTDPTLTAEALAVLEGLHSRLGQVEHDLRIELELMLASALTRPDQRTECLDRLRDLLAEPGGEETAMTRLARSAVTLGDVLSSTVLRVDDVAAALEQLIDVDQLVSDDPLMGRVQTTVLFGLLCADRFAAVDELLKAAQARRAAGDPHLVGERLRVLSVLSLLWQGSLVEADEQCTRSSEARNVATRTGDPRSVTGHVDILVQQGRIEEAERLAHSTDPDQLEPSLFGALSQIELGRLLAARGDSEQAVRLFEAAGDTAAQAGIVNPAMVPWRAETVVALVDLGEWQRAARLAEENLLLARTFGAARTTGIALRAAAAAAPNLATRTELLSEAVEVLNASPARLEWARALVDLGTALIEGNRKEEARSVLRQGARLASLCGAHQLLEVAGDRLRAAGARPRRLGLVGPGSLTPAELRVARMAADGLTNQRIADELYVTLKTVEGHLAKAYRKLAVDGRPELAGALVGREGTNEGEDPDEGDADPLLQASAV